MKINLFYEDSNVLKKMKSTYVCIYGAGDLGRDTKFFLESKDIFVHSFVVDNEYYKENKEFCNKPIICLEEANEKASKQSVFLIWAIASPSKLKYEMENNNIKEVWLTYDQIQMWKDTKYATKNSSVFEETRSLFADECSKVTFDAYLKAVSGAEIEDDLRIIQEGTYFNDLTKCELDGAFVDCGAYIGDSALAFAKVYGTKQKIIAFEPDSGNYKKLIENTKHLDVKAINVGCWSKKDILHFNDGVAAASAFDNLGMVEVDVDSIDNVVETETVSFIKMDVEGSELEALIGAKQTILRDMPILAISAYHKQEDLVELPRFIVGCETKDYKYDLYLRHHGCTKCELVLYGIPVKKGI